LIAITGLLFLTSCATFKSVSVLVPKSASQNLSIPEKPKLPVTLLNKNSKPNDVMKAYVESLYILDDYADELAIMLKADN
jgi:hypothetical protein